MTAVNVICQPRHKCLHVLTDAATYTSQGVLVGVGTKTFVEPNWPGVITGRGSAIAVPLLGNALSLSFASFDGLVAGIESVLEGMVRYYKIDGHAELIIAGFSTDRDGPEAYVIETTDADPVGCSADVAAQAKADGFLPDAFKLQRLPDCVVGPVPSAEVIEASGFDAFDADDDPAFVVAGLASLIELQRHSVSDDGICWVGGHAQLTTINSSGVHQRIIKRWPEDRIGEMITPGLAAWAEHHDAPSNVVALDTGFRA